MNRISYKYRFSVFTATYNRAAMLQTLYNCIKEQTYTHSDFEWVIISDGSTDNTSNMVNNFLKEGVVNIKYIEKENGGKHTAWKVATDVFEGKYIISADDDDLVTPDMLSVFDKYWSELENQDNYEEFWEVRTRAQFENGNLVGKRLPTPYFDSDYNELTYKLQKGAEMIGCRKAQVLRDEACVPDSFLFEEYCSNFPEGVRWSRAARKYKTRFVPDVTRTYMIGHESLCLSKHGRSLKRNYNSLISSLYFLNEVDDLLVRYNIREYLILIMQLSYSSLRVRQRVLRYVKKKHTRILVMLSYLPAFILYLIRR